MMGEGKVSWRQREPASAPTGRSSSDQTATIGW